MLKNQRTFEEILNTIDEQKLRRLYFEDLLSIEDIAVELGVCRSTMYKLIQHFELVRDKKQVKARSVNDVKKAFCDNIIQNTPKGLLEDYYITQDNGYYETMKHFNISEDVFRRLLKIYDLKKDRSKSFEKGLQKRKERYGEDNINNWKKGFATRIQNSGSLEKSFVQASEKQQTTMRSKYGVTCSFLSDKVNKHKKHTKPNETFAKQLDKLNISYGREFALKNKAFDFKVEDTLIEINPIITHNSTFNPFDKAHDYKGLDKNYHLHKSQVAWEHGYKCMHVWPWDDIKCIGNKLKAHKIIEANLCEVKVLPKVEAREFFKKLSTKDFKNLSKAFGLFYEQNLIAGMTFKRTYNNWELIDYCECEKVLGGVQKLFQYFIESCKPEKIFGRYDLSKSDDNIYEELGFINYKNIKPTLHWCDLHLQHYTEKEALKLIKEATTEKSIEKIHEQMLEKNFLEVYDCGYKKYKWLNIKA